MTTTIKRVRIRHHYHTQIRQNGRLISNRRWKPGDIKKKKFTLPTRPIKDKRTRRYQIVFSTAYELTIRVWINTDKELDTGMLEQLAIEALEKQDEQYNKKHKDSQTSHLKKLAESSTIGIEEREISEEEAEDKNIWHWQITK